jgi:hypothetical protein
MASVLYQCPNTGFRVQGYTQDETITPDHDAYEPVTCWRLAAQVPAVKQSQAITLDRCVEGPALSHRKPTHASKSVTASKLPLDTNANPGSRGQTKSPGCSRGKVSGRM